MADLIGKSLGRYQILEQLGEGGMAIVYKTFDTQLERDVAIKVISTAEGESDRVLQRFQLEARVLGQLNHPSITPILDFGNVGGKVFFVTDYYPNGTLKEKIGKPISWKDAANILYPIASALAFANEHDIVHRDVKPSNILFDHQNKPVLSDFGIAKILQQEETVDLTGSGIIGTPFYMSPEQHRGHFVDHRSDIYSLGIVFYELITGRKPFYDPTPIGILLQQTRKPLTAPRKFVRKVPAWVEEMLAVWLAPDPNHRFQTTVELVQFLKEMSLGHIVTLPEKYQKPAIISSSRSARMTRWIFWALLPTVTFAVFIFWNGRLSGNRQGGEAFKVPLTTTPPLVFTATLTSLMQPTELFPTIIPQPSQIPTLESNDEGSIISIENAAQLESLELLPGYFGSIMDAGISPSGEEVVTISNFNNVNLWYLETQKHTDQLISGEISGHGTNRQVLFSHDAKYMAVLVDYAGVILWRVQDGSLVQNFKGPTKIMAFSPASENLAIGYYTNMDVENYDLSPCETNQTNCGVMRGVVNPGSPAVGLSYSQDGRLIWIRTRSSISIWRPLDGTNLKKNSDIPFSEGDPLIPSPTGDFFYTHNSIWNTDDFSLVHNFSDSQTHFETMAFSPDGSIVLLVNGNKITLYDVNIGISLKELATQTESAILEINFVQNGKYIIGVTEDGTLERWGIP